MVIKGIIQRVKQIINVYRAVKQADKISQELEADNPTQVQATGYQAWDPATAAVKRRLMSEYRKITVPKANAIIMDSIQMKYFDPHTEKDKGKDVDVLHINTKGGELIDNYMFIPWGLIGALWGRHGKVLAGILGFLIGLAPTLVWVIKHI